MTLFSHSWYRDDNTGEFLMIIWGFPLDKTQRHTIPRSLRHIRKSSLMTWLLTYRKRSARMLDGRRLSRNMIDMQVFQGTAAEICRTCTLLFCLVIYQSWSVPQELSGSIAWMAFVFPHPCVGVCLISFSDGMNSSAEGPSYSMARCGTLGL